MKIFEVFNANKMFYKTIQVWTAVVKQNGAWHNYYMKIMPSYAEAQESKPVIKTSSFMVLHESFKSNDFDNILNCLKSGKIEVCDIEVHLNLRMVERNGVYYLNLDREMRRFLSQRAWEMFEEKYPLYRFELDPSSSISLPPNRDLELWTLDEPYTDIRDVLQELLKIKWDSIHSGVVNILLPTYLALRACYFEEKALRFTADFHNKMKNNVDLGIILRTSKGDLRRYSRPINETKLTLRDGFYYYDDFEPIDDDIVSGRVFLRHKKFPLISVESGEIIRLKPSSQFKIFEKFWTEKQLERCLQGRFREDQGFEWGISVLLTLCGFKVHWIGWLRGEVALGGVDLFFFHNDTLIVGECTVGTVGNDEIDKLLQAVREISETLGLKETTTLKIVPVIFTCVKISNETKESAYKSGVRIKDLEDVMKIFNSLRMNKPKEEIINLLRETVYFYGF